MRLLPAALLALLLLPQAAAHAAGPAGHGDTLANATWLGATPGRAFDALPWDGGSHYHGMRLAPGEAVRVRLVAGEGAFPRGAPLVVVAGPGLPQDAFVPPGVEVAEGAGALTLFPLDARETRVEPWIPARLDVALERTFVAPAGGTYHFVVVADESGGPFALLIEPASGRAWSDWFAMATLRRDLAAWQGEPPARRWLEGALGAVLVLAPFVALGWRRRPWALTATLGAAAAGFFGASAAIAAGDAWRAGAEAPLLLPAAASAAVALALLALALRPGPPGWPRRAGLVAAALAGGLAFAGLTWGPVLALGAALAPAEDPAADVLPPGK